MCNVTSLSWYLPYESRLWWEDKAIARWLEVYRFAKVRSTTCPATAAVLSIQRFIQNQDHHGTPSVINRIQTIFGADDPVYEFFVDNYAFTGPFKQYSFPEEMPTSFLLKVLEKRAPTADRYDENGQSIITGHVDEDPSNHNMTWCYAMDTRPAEREVRAKRPTNTTMMFAYRADRAMRSCTTLNRKLVRMAVLTRLRAAQTRERVVGSMYYVAGIYHLLQENQTPFEIHCDGIELSSSIQSLRGCKLAKRHSSTDLYTHRTRVPEGTLPSQSARKRWSAPQKYWLDKLIQEGLDAGMYESTKYANGELSSWCSQPVLVLKDKDAEKPDPWEEHRLTFNYQKVTEEMPGLYIPLLADPLLADVLKDISDPRVGCYSSFDLKHAY